MPELPTESRDVKRGHNLSQSFVGYSRHLTGITSPIGFSTFDSIKMRQPAITVSVASGYSKKSPHPLLHAVHDSRVISEADHRVGRRVGGVRCRGYAASSWQPRCQHLVCNATHRGVASASRWSIFGKHSWNPKAHVHTNRMSKKSSAVQNASMRWSGFWSGMGCEIHDFVYNVRELEPHLSRFFASFSLRRTFSESVSLGSNPRGPTNS